MSRLAASVDVDRGSRLLTVGLLATALIALAGLAHAKCDVAEWDLSRVSADMPDSEQSFDSDGWIEEYEPHSSYVFHSGDVAFSLVLVQ